MGGGDIYNIKNKKGFTLVELIIVITILLILATIGFLNFGNYASEARDSVRISDLKNIEKALLLYEIKEGEFPEPDRNLENKEIFGENNFLLVKKLNKLPKDPKTQKEYFYEKIGNGYYLSAILENGKRYNLYGGVLNFRNCKEIFKRGISNKNGLYSIYPNGRKIEVFCDLETFDENGETGWTRYLNIKGNYNLKDANNCWSGEIISNENLDCFNPNRYEMRAEKFMLKQNGKKYFYDNPKPNPSINSISNISETNRRKCLGGNNYMTIMNIKDKEGFEEDNFYYIWLGLNFCSGYSRSVGGIWSQNKYMNYSYGGKFGIAPGNREENIENVEIYIK